jgi:hypothetical protein
MQKLAQDGRTMNLQKGEPSSHRVLSYADDIAVLWQDFLLLVGRVMIGWIFLQSGWGKLFNIAGVARPFRSEGCQNGWHTFLSPPSFSGASFFFLALQRDIRHSSC